jgi:uncharacterized protein
MQLDSQGLPLFSPHDLMNFFESEFSTWMDYARLFDKTLTPDEDDAASEILQRRGLQHEQAFAEQLRQSGINVVTIPDDRHRGFERTLEAMRSGAEVIYQGQLAHGSFAGVADFLFRVDGISAFGNWAYEAWDTKLARAVKPEFIIQLCCYSEMLNGLQGVLPKQMGIVLGDGARAAIRTEDYIAFYRQLERAFLEYIGTCNPASEPDEIVITPFCRWKTRGEEMIRQRDDLSLVANIRRVQIKKLRAADIHTVKQLAAASADFIVTGMRQETLDTLRHQARCQVEAELTNGPVFELLPVSNERRGFKLLPPAHDLDIWFDMEGYTLDDPPLQYLFGATYLDKGAPAFKHWWAHTREQERSAFESFIDWAYKRWIDSDRKMHVYHYASYELTAIRKLMQMYGTRESEVDEFMRNEVLVDLYRIVRQAVRVGEPSYSIKYVEHLYRGKREESVASAVDSIVVYDKWRDNPDDSLLQQILDYNKVDCESTYDLTRWLWQRQSEAGVAFEPKPAKEEKPPTPQQLKDGDCKARCAELSLRLTQQLDAIPDSEQRQLQELLAHLLQFHEREDKPTWWEVFQRSSLSEEELFDDSDCLAGLARMRNLGTAGRQKQARWRYAFDPNQETTIADGSRCCLAHNINISVEVEDFDATAGELTLKDLGPDIPERISLIPFELPRSQPLREAILKIVEHWASTKTLPPAIADFLARRPPQILGRQPGQPIFDDLGNATEQAIDLISNMRTTTICVQGPPGSGKTATAAEVIVRLIQSGKRIAVSSNSHAAIENLLATVERCARARKVTLRGWKVSNEPAKSSLVGTQFTVAKKETVAKEIDRGNYDVVGATAWFLCTDQAQGKFDYLFVDEAGQVSVANLVAMSRCSKNIVLLGDQMQLEQPTQGHHPGESGLSTLQYYLRDHATIPAELGIFLGQTWRMHPRLCEVISRSVYEDRLAAAQHTSQRILKLPAHPLKHVRKTAGLLFVPVEHNGNDQKSLEEAQYIQEIVAELLQCQRVESDGKQRALRQQDILVVAPYNLQVKLLRQMLPDGVRVGTVDKFQGQQAPVSILSMCASDANDSPRGLAFLFDKHRLNVALSRAETLAIVVGNPKLVNTRCSSLKSMELINFYCRIVDSGTAPGDVTSTETSAVAGQVL